MANQSIERNLFLRICILAFIIFLIDLPWLTTISGWANSMIRSIQGSDMKFVIWPAIVVYIALGYLATIPTSYTEAFLQGFAVYAVYDFTNLAMIKNYQPAFAIADSTWGGVLFTIVYGIREYFKI